MKVSRAVLSFLLLVVLPLLGLLTLQAEAGQPAASQSPAVPQNTPANPPAPPLASLLAKTAAYCGRLEASAFDFVCREEIRETIDPKLDVAAKGTPVNAAPVVVTSGSGQAYLGPTLIVTTVRKLHRSFVYDYQCIRAGRAIREIRTEIEENGKKKNVPNAELQTSTVVWGTALLGPVGLLGERFQGDYIYTQAGEEVVNGLKAVVVDAKPRPGAPPSRNLYGKAWIDPATGDVLKIEWSENRVGHFDVFAARGELYQRTPRLTIVSEFSAEKNGLRFPTHLEVEEAYLKKSGKPFVRSKTEVVYKDFKFFTVEVEVRQ